MSQGARLGPCLSQLKLQCLGHGRTLPVNSNLTRVTTLYPPLCAHHEIRPGSIGGLFTSLPIRTYATKPVSRPKAHTGQPATTSKRTPTTSATKAAKRPAPKRTSAKAKPDAKSKAKPRIKAKAKAKPKPRKTKAKAKAKPKPKKKPLSEYQKKLKAVRERKEKIAQLKKTALEPPKVARLTAWLVLVREHLLSHPPGGTRQAFTNASVQFKQLAPEQLEHYNHVANQDSVAKAQAYRRFIESHSPIQIYEANRARRALKQLKAAKPTHTLLKDDRQVSHPSGPYMLFYVDRQKSGDFKGLKVAEASKLASREWKGLTADEKKRYRDAAAQEMARYVQEKKTVLDLDVEKRTKSAAAAAAAAA